MSKTAYLLSSALIIAIKEKKGKVINTTQFLNKVTENNFKRRLKVLRKDTAFKSTTLVPLLPIVSVNTYTHTHRTVHNEKSSLMLITHIIRDICLQFSYFSLIPFFLFFLFFFLLLLRFLPCCSFFFLIAIINLHPDTIVIISKDQAIDPLDYK